MPLSRPDFRHRAQLIERMDEPCSRNELRGCLSDIARLNRWFLAHRPTLRWLESFVSVPRAEPMHILDVGCGSGDGLRRVEQWARAHRIAVKLTGIDLNPDAVAIAAEVNRDGSNIEWVSGDVFTYAPGKPVHLVLSTQFTHHLSDDEVVRFIRWMEEHAELGWFINDLSRAAIPYYSFKAFAKVVGLHSFVQYDGPASIAKAFLAEDWRRMCAAAGLGDQDISIQGFAPARLCVGRRKPQ